MHFENFEIVVVVPDVRERSVRQFKVIFDVADTHDIAKRSCDLLVGTCDLPGVSERSRNR